MKRRYHKYNNDWIREHKGDFRSWSEMCKEYNRIFGTDIERVRFKIHCNKLGLRLDNYFYTEEEKNWLKENYPVLGAKKTAEEFNKKFQKNKNEQTLREECWGLGLKLNKETFKKYREKTTKAMVEHTKNARASEVGTIGLPNRDYSFIKTENGWESIGRYLYKKHIGEIPEGYQIIFLDGNKENLEISNLAAVPKSYQALMNTYKLRSEFAEITRTGIMLCELHEALRKSEEE